MRDLTAILEQGRALHEQMVAAGKIRHAFVPHRIDDRCDACGLSPKNDVHALRNTILVGDVREKLHEIPDESVQCVVTSPPYWGLRDYGTASWEGGDDGCDHRLPVDTKSRLTSGLNLAKNYDAAQSNVGHRFEGYKHTCGKCGARRVDNQLGLERTPEEYVCNLVAVFREVRRVLRSDGTVWLNLGDSYASTGRSGRKESPGVGATQAMDAPGRTLKWEAGGGHNFSWSIPSFGTEIKPKDMVGIPWRVAFALQADGWYLRSDIIWSKPNPIPESVTDRPTKAHEYLFLLSKSQRYYYDQSAIAEPYAESSIDRISQGGLMEQEGGYKQELYQQDFPGRKRHDRKPADILKSMSKHMQATSRNDGERWRDYDGGVAPRGMTRNRRTVWEIPTEPYAEAHFATYPTALVKPCILAGSREGDLVLDPFLGSGTTAAVAKVAGRDWLGIELNPEYAELARARINTAQERLL